MQEEKEKAGLNEFEDLVTVDMIISDILKEYPDAVFPLMECGMGCVGCPSAAGETLEEASRVHGLKGQEVADYVNDWLAHEGKEMK